MRRKSLRGDGAIYLVMGITKGPENFVGNGNSSDGGNTFSGLAVSSGNYGGGIQDTIISPCAEKQMGAPLTPEAQFALGYELGG